MSSSCAWAADSCPNAQYRTGASASLPSCRAYEQVSPADKNGVAVTTGASVTVASDGSRAAYASTGGFDSSSSAPLINTYLGTRGGSTWTSIGVDPPLSQIAQFSASPTIAVSRDGTKALVVTRQKLTADAVQDSSNLYVRDLTQPGQYRLVVTDPGGALYREFTSYNAGKFYGATADFTHIAFQSALGLAGASPAADGQNLYRWDNGTLRYVDTALPGPAPRPEANLMSEDGRRVTYYRLANAALGIYGVYQQVDAGAPRLLTHAYTGSDRTSPRTIDSGFTVSPDGRAVVFSAAEPLTAGARDQTTYRWSAATDNLTDLLGSLVPPTGPTQNVRLGSADGRYVYFVTSARLTPDAQPDPSNSSPYFLYALDTASRTLDLVVTQDSGLDTFDVKLSPNGHRLAIRQFTPVAGFDNTNAACTDPANAPRDGFCGEIYTYDADTPSTPLACVSCPPAGSQPGSDATFGFESATPTPTYLYSHPITDDGRVYFDTGDKLTSGDINSQRDVYEHANGAPQLISTGRGATPATLGDVTPSGDDVLFLTADPLVPQDGDSVRDLYDARVGGGLAAQQVPPPSTTGGCGGSDCRPTPPAQPPAPKPGTSLFQELPRTRASSYAIAKPSASAVRGLSRTGRIRVAVKVGGAGSVRARLYARLGGRTRSVGSGSATARRAGTVRITLRLSAAARRELARAGRLGLRLDVTFSKSSRKSTLRFTARTSSSARGGAR